MILDAADLALLEIECLQEVKDNYYAPFPGIALTLISEIRTLRAENERLRTRVRVEERLNEYEVPESNWEEE